MSPIPFFRYRLIICVAIPNIREHFLYTNFTGMMFLRKEGKTSLFKLVSLKPENFQSSTFSVGTNSLVLYMLKAVCRCFQKLVGK